MTRLKWWRKNLVTVILRHMPADKQTVFEEHSKLISRAAVLVRKRADQCDKLAHNEASSEDPGEVLFNIFRIQSMRIFAQYLDFVAKKIAEKCDQRTYVHYLSAIRTIGDIYARFLYAHDQSIDFNKR